jgi:hypothetical protein
MTEEGDSGIYGQALITPTYETKYSELRTNYSELKEIQVAEIVEKAVDVSQGLRTFEPEILAFCCEH